MWDVHYVLLARRDSRRHAGTDEAAEISRVGHTGQLSVPQVPGHQRQGEQQ